MEINRSNYPNWLIKYMEGELSKNDKLKVEGFTILHEEAAEELRKLEQTRLQPDTDIIYPRKKLLLKYEEGSEETSAPAPVKRISRIWLSSAAIAAMILLALLFRTPSKIEKHGTAMEQQKESPAVKLSSEPKNSNTALVMTGNTVAAVKPKLNRTKENRPSKKVRTPKKETLRPAIKPADPVENHSTIIVSNNKPMPDAKTIKQLAALNDLVHLAKSTANVGRNVNNITPPDASANGDDAIRQKAPQGFFNNLAEFFRYKLSIGRQDEGSAYAVSFKTNDVDISKTLK